MKDAGQEDSQEFPHFFYLSALYSINQLGLVEQRSSFRCFRLQWLIYTHFSHLSQSFLGKVLVEATSMPVRGKIRKHQKWHEFCGHPVYVVSPAKKLWKDGPDIGGLLRSFFDLCGVTVRRFHRILPAWQHG
jgi:hypothetical protein